MILILGKFYTTKISGKFLKRGFLLSTSSFSFHIGWNPVMTVVSPHRKDPSGTAKQLYRRTLAPELSCEAKLPNRL